MAAASLRNFRDRLSAPLRDGPPGRASRPRVPEAERLLTLASLLFGVPTVATVLAAPDGFAVEGASGAAAAAVQGAACRLFEALAAAPDPSPGVMEEISSDCGFVAAAPLVSGAGRCFGAVCLLDGARRSLLSGFQRRLFAEIGDLLASRLAAPHRAASPPADALRRAADAEPDAFALFDPEGRCFLRNALFDALLGAVARPGASPEAVGEARGREAGWLADRLMRDRPPVGLYRAALADGTWLCVEERRGPLGRSLVARIEDDEFGDPEARLLFERCPLPMFVFDRETRGILAANDAALSLYGWDRGAFLTLPVDALGPVPGRGNASGTWAHRARDGRALAVSCRTTPLVHRGRASVLVTVSRSAPGLVRAA